MAIARRERGGRWRVLIVITMARAMIIAGMGRVIICNQQKYIAKREPTVSAFMVSASFLRRALWIWEKTHDRYKGENLNDLDGGGAPPSNKNSERILSFQDIAARCERGESSPSRDWTQQLWWWSCERTVNSRCTSLRSSRNTQQLNSVAIHSGLTTYPKWKERMIVRPTIRNQFISLSSNSCWNWQPEQNAAAESDLKYYSNNGQET